MLGAGPLRRLRHVTLPAVAPGMAVAALFAFLISWSEYILTLLIGGGTVQTLPLLLFASIGSADLTAAAALSLVIAAPPVLLVGPHHPVPDRPRPRRPRVRSRCERARCPSVTQPGRWPHRAAGGLERGRPDRRPVDVVVPAGTLTALLGPLGLREVRQCSRSSPGCSPRARARSVSTGSPLPGCPPSAGPSAWSSRSRCCSATSRSATMSRSACGCAGYRDGPAPPRAEMLELVGFAGLAGGASGSCPAARSSGWRSPGAVLDPRVLLLDEPFSRSTSTSGPHAGAGPPRPARPRGHDAVRHPRPAGGRRPRRRRRPHARRPGRGRGLAVAFYTDPPSLAAARFFGPVTTSSPDARPGRCSPARSARSRSTPRATARACWSSARRPAPRSDPTDAEHRHRRRCCETRFRGTYRTVVLAAPRDACSSRPSHPRFRSMPGDRTHVHLPAAACRVLPAGATGTTTDPSENARA